MTNRLYLLLLFLLATSFNFKNDKTTKNLPAKIVNHLNIKKNSKPTQGLYLDSSFVSILGNKLKEDSLLKWAEKYQYNKFSYYHMGKILVSDMKGPLALFIERAKNAGIEDHTAILGGHNTLELIKKFNASEALNSRFTSIQIEDEWWHSENSLKDYKNVITVLKSMKEWGSQQQPLVAVDLYFGRFNNILGTPDDAADTLVKYTDRVLIAHQFDDPLKNIYPNYLKNRVNRFNKAAKKIQKKYPIIIILYPGQAPIYYGQHSYQTIYSNLINRKWNNKVRKKDLVHGYQIFAYTEAFQLNQ